MIVTFLWYLCYVYWYIYKYGFPESLSATYYQTKWHFSALMFVSAIGLLPAWLDITEGHDLQFIAFLTCMGLMFVGTAPDYKNDSQEYKIHCTCAYIAVGLALIFLMCLSIGYYIIPICLCLNLIKYTKDTWIFRIENTLMQSTYLTLIYETYIKTWFIQ